LLSGFVAGTALAPLHPFILGLTLMFWATATWWIPMLLVLGVWRHRIRGVRLVYDPLYWGLVFPLGMYSVCTYRLAQALELTQLVWISRVFVIAAAVAWLLTFLGLARWMLYAMLLGHKGNMTGALQGGTLAPNR
jgi:tellurite resistance protein TehA-like permease